MSSIDSTGERLGPAVRTFDRGLDVLTSFSRTRYAQSTSEIAAETGLDRTSVRRVVRTLEALGYLEAVGTRYQLTAKVLDLGYAALAARDFSELAQPYLEQIAESSGQSCSLGVLDEDAAVCVARAAVRRVLSISLAPGSRVPAFASALGRVLLSDVDEAQLRPYLHGLQRIGYTERTVTDVDELVRRIDEVRRQGWALVDQELELGVRGVAVPVRSRAGTVVAAISLDTNVSGVDVPTLTTEILPTLLSVANELERDLTAQPVPLPVVGAPPSHPTAT